MITQDEIDNIRMLCLKYDIRRYSINDDGSIDVGNHVDLSKNKLTELPLKFNRVIGNFMCGANLLTTLKGAPSYVSGYFNCNNNKLTSLKGGPIRVGGYYSCVKNKLASLDYAPVIFDKFIFFKHAINWEELIILNKYYPHYDVFKHFNDEVLVNMDNYDLLMEDIKEGLR